MSFDLMRDGNEINYYLEVENTEFACLEIKSKVISISEIANSSVVVCEGENGWSDIIFLHHYPENDPI